jgi:nitroreductase
LSRKRARASAEDTERLDGIWDKKLGSRGAKIAVYALAAGKINVGANMHRMPDTSAGLAALNLRRSVPARLLSEPGPTPEQLHTLLAAAVRVPDHGKLTPWRFLKIAGDSRQRLGERLVARAQERDPGAPEAALEKDRQRFSSAPTIIAVIARITPEHKVPEIEKLLSGGAVCFALLQAAQALGFGAQWLTGWPAYDPVIQALLGVGENERVLGFIHIGTPRETAPERTRPDPNDLLTELRL